MATKRTAQPLAEFAKLNEIGAAAFGAIVKFGENNSGPFITFEPAGYRARKGEKFMRYAELSLGLSTDLATKITASDVGTLLLCVLVATKPTAKSPMKIFNVWTLNAAEARTLINNEGDLPGEWMEPPTDVMDGRRDQKTLAF